MLTELANRPTPCPIYLSVDRMSFIFLAFHIFVLAIHYCSVDLSIEKLALEITCDRWIVVGGGGGGGGTGGVGCPLVPGVLQRTKDKGSP